MRALALLLASSLCLPLGTAEPVVPPPAPPVAQDEAAIVVFVTATGKKYHRESCRYAKIRSNLKEAKARGLGPCAFCNP